MNDAITLTPEQLAGLLGAQARYKNAATSPLGVPPTGPNGLFSTPGIQPGIISTIVQPDEGLEGFLERNGHVLMSQFESPIFETLTGQRASVGTEPTTSCVGGKTPGALKICRQIWPFGEFTMNSDPLDISKAGQYFNRAQPLDLRFANDPFASIPKPIPVNGSDIFQNWAALEVVKLLNAFFRDYRSLIWTGNPQSTAGNTGGYIQYNGLEQLVRTGYQDVYAGVACPSLDSLVVPFDNLNIQTNPGYVAQVLVEAYRATKKLARQLNIGDLQLAFFGRYGMFLKLTEIWPCTYNTYRCETAAPAGNATIFVDGSDMSEMRDELRRGSYLMIDGDRVPFIQDESIPETAVGTQTFSSDLYLLPLAAPSLGTPDNPRGLLLYMEYFNFRGPNGAAAIAELMGGVTPMGTPYYRFSNDGRFLIHFLPPTYWCQQISIRTRKRLILRAPFLATRFGDLAYQLLIHERSPFPGDPYFVNGGAYTNTAPTAPYGNFTS